MHYAIVCCVNLNLWPVYRSKVCFTTAVSACAHQAGQIKETVQIYQTPFGMGPGHQTIFSVCHMKTYMY